MTFRRLHNVILKSKWIRIKVFWDWKAANFTCLRSAAVNLTVLFMKCCSSGNLNLLSMYKVTPLMQNFYLIFVVFYCILFLFSYIFSTVFYCYFLLFTYHIYTSLNVEFFKMFLNQNFFIAKLFRQMHKLKLKLKFQMKMMTLVDLWVLVKRKGLCISLKCP